MRLIKGSYFYLIGIFILALASGCATVAFLFFVFARDIPEINPLLSCFGARISAGTVTAVCSAVFSVAAVFCSLRMLLEGLKKNTISGALRIVSLALLLYAALIVADTAIYAVWTESVWLIILRFARVLPPICLFLVLTLLPKNVAKWKTPTMLLCLVNAGAVYTGFGFENILQTTERAARAAQIGWTALFLFSSALFLFFLGITFCIGGCEKKSPKKAEPAENKGEA